MENLAKDVPREVFQPNGSYKCWAAALISWLEVTGNKAALELVENVDEAVRLFAKDKERGGLDVKKELKLMADIVSMDYRRFLRHEMKQLTSDLLHSRLRYKGHLYIVASGGTVTATPELAHAGVIWAMSEWSGKDPFLFVMDPIYGLTYKQLSYYRGAVNAILGWPV